MRFNYLLGIVTILNSLIVTNGNTSDVVLECLDDNVCVLKCNKEQLQIQHPDNCFDEVDKFTNENISINSIVINGNNREMILNGFWASNNISNMTLINNNNNQENICKNVVLNIGNCIGNDLRTTGCCLKHLWLTCNGFDSIEINNNPISVQKINPIITDNEKLIIYYNGFEMGKEYGKVEK